MKGVQFIIDKRGNPTSVILDLAIWHEIWEDIYDGIVLESRKDEEPTITLEELQMEMKQEIFAND